MSTLVRQRTVSATSAAGPRDTELAPLVHDLTDIDTSSLAALQRSIESTGCLLQLRHILIDQDGQNEAHNAFRHVKGFQALLGCIDSLSKVSQKCPFLESEKKEILQTLGQALAVLAAALQGHAGNQKYFRTRIEDGGWKHLQRSLIKLDTEIHTSEGITQITEQLFGLLFATAVGDEVLSTIYLSVGKSSSTSVPNKAGAKEAPEETMRSKIKRFMAAESVELSNPDLLPIIAALWLPHSRKPNAATRPLASALPISLFELLSSSRQNAVAAHTSGLLTAILPLLFENSDAMSHFQSVGVLLCEQGISSLDDAYFLFSKASTSSQAASFLLKAVRASREPPRIQFDLSSGGYSSAEFASLVKSFPPTETAGYTLAFWACFDRFDPATHTTIFGAFDPTQTCFVLAYLEKDSHHFILQTAIRGSKPSVRFKSTSFETGRWYHVCIVHRRPRTTSSSKASLFVDGEFIEQVKATYPATPPQEKGLAFPRIQAFFGTPQDLAPSTTGIGCVSQWSLASALLFQDTLSDDLLSVIYYLGPRYHGNFQDCLGSFQTYSASAALNLRNENLHPGREEKSDVIRAIRDKASKLIKEDLVLLNISPAAVLDNDERNNIDESQLVKSLSRLAAKNLQHYTRSGGNAVVINGAVPAINDALTQQHGVAVLTGEPAVIVSQSLDDAAWRIGGCAAVGLNLVSIARSTEDVLCSVNTLLETVSQSWRNSEVMERDHGYAILASLLREKLGINVQNSAESGKITPAVPTPCLDRSRLAFEVLQVLLKFLGFDFEHLEESIINNPLAYRVLLIDSNIWRCGSHSVQDLYFQQFQVFSVQSRNNRFNLKRLTRMRVLKRLLEALKTEAVTSQVMSMYIETFKILMPTALSAEMLRSLALFVTYAVHKQNFSLKARKSIRRDGRSRPSSNGGTPPGEEISPTLTRFDIGVEILRLYSDVLCAKGEDSLIKKFAKTVTNKWLLYLMAESSPEVVVLATRILARLLVIHGEVYVKKFKEKSNGFTIMRHRLKRWWHIPAIWPACFAILFNVDVGQLELDRPFDVFGLLDVFSTKKDFQIVYPDIFEVIVAMLQNGLKSVVHGKSVPSSSSLGPIQDQAFPQAQQRLSMSTMAPPDPLVTVVSKHHIDTFNTVIRFMADLQSRSQRYRDYAASSRYVEDFLHVLFPVVVGSDVVDATVELNARDSALTFDGDDVIVQPLSKAPPIIRTADVETSNPLGRGKNLGRGSSFVLVTAEDVKMHSSLSRSESIISPTSPVAKIPELNESSQIVQSILEIVVSVFSDQILSRKDFPGLGLFLRTPPGFIEHQSYFESWILRNTLSQLSNTIMLDRKVLWEPKVLTNLSRLFSHIGEAFFEGWFIGGADATLDLAGAILEYLQRPDVAKIKSVRLCNQSISIIRAVVFRILLLSLSQVQDTNSLAFLEKLAYWQTVLLSAEEQKSGYLEMICYLLYGSLISSQKTVRLAAANLWRIILVQKPEEAAAILDHATSSEHRRLVASFEKLVEIDNETFLYWVDEHRSELDSLFFDTLSKSWDRFVAEENKKTEENARQRVGRRREKLKQWAREENDAEDAIRRHEITFGHWTSNIYSSESLKHQRVAQDHQDDLLFTDATFARMQRDVRRPVGFLAELGPQKWRLDQTEGRNRMRLRLTEDFTTIQEERQPKKKATDVPSLRIDTKSTQLSSIDAVGVTPGGMTPTVESPHPLEKASEPFPELPESGVKEDGADLDADESFEMIENPDDGLDVFEDKNRKVMRSLHLGDQVKHVANISRIVGLEAIEGLLILGTQYLYLIDNFFQRADGEIVNVWQAPQEERDSYVRMISGRDVVVRKPTQRSDEHETRSWKWSEIISVSKRRFLFRDVAVEIFFGDGRSYLLTVISSQSRNELHTLISTQAPQSPGNNGVPSETAWRYETLKSVDEEPQTLGSRFANVFNQSSTPAATRKWQKGELSNFHYLMLINTMAGRTYNDLTQYPVFPWVIADYTSDELDLNNPKTFRDLSKPMGCQTPQREAEFKERYKSFAEMGDHNSPAFHYGTHYSSAMIVTSYLIRLQPFVKSYLLLQGGSFDHPDRLFFSVEGAWRSASRQNMTDVRELTPEFFCLPEFLVNLNGYDFGTRQNSDKSIGSVELPPWAKGDPRIFIAKQRQALESPYVSQNLHKWIDLVFGYKQKGDAALEAVNVFHHLSYQGARDLDNIIDPVERLATIGIIHNFGQTPYQIFPKAHPAREGARHQYKRLDTAAESLTRLPFNLLESEERVASLSYSWKQERLLCSGAFRLNIPPNYDRYMEWGFSDGSVRFYASESRKLMGLFEHLHVGQLSGAVFADSTTLVTAGTDCTVSVWNVVMVDKSMELQLKASLFGHRHPVTVLALSRSFNVLLTASSGKEVFLWNLNRCEFVRKIEDSISVECASVNDVTGNVVLCHGAYITMYTINGELLLTQDSGDKEHIISCACYEGAGNEWLERDILFTGHKRGIVRVWNKVVRGERFELELIRQLNHVDQSLEHGGNVSAGISCILPMPQVVYTGDEEGRVYEWDCVQRH